VKKVNNLVRFANYLLRNHRNIAASGQHPQRCGKRLTLARPSAYQKPIQAARKEHHRFPPPGKVEIHQPEVCSTLHGHGLFSSRGKPTKLR